MEALDHGRMRPRIGILVSASLSPKLQERIREDRCPRNDMIALAERLGARLIQPFQHAPAPAGSIGKMMGLLRAAWTGFRRRGDYDVLVSDLDRVGLALASLLKLSRARTRHVVICHGKMIRPQDLWLLRTLRLHSHIDRFICYGPFLARRLRDELGLPPERTPVVRHPADHHFWRPRQVAPERLIVSAGMLRRDYPLLIEAVRDLDVSLVIAAASPWMAAQYRGPDGKPLPGNVRITRCSPEEMRDLYARAAFVAVPLLPSRAQAGSLVVYEAMAMGKAALATRTEGQEALDLITEGETGLTLAPGDLQGWRRAIRFLLDHPDEAARMGGNARDRVESELNMDRYIGDMEAVLTGVGDEARATAPLK